MATKQSKTQSSSRAIAAIILGRVLQHKGSLASELGGRVRIDAEHLTEVREFCFGVMRWYFELDGLLQQLLKKGIRNKDSDLRALLLIGLYQAKHMRVPVHASVSETVAAAGVLNKQWAKALINAVLRNYERQTDELHSNLSPAQRQAFPDWLFNHINTNWPLHSESIFEASNGRPPMTIRVNAQHHTREQYLEILATNAIVAHISTTSMSAITLEKPTDVFSLPGFELGEVSVQDSSAQLAAELMDLEHGHHVLDACCAPGGKTGHLLEYCDGIDLDAVDNNAQRLSRVEENLQRLGMQANLVVADAGEAAQWSWPSSEYDRILLDVPCSATGVLRRNPDIKFLRRADDLAPLHAQQHSILHSCWQRLKPGGKLLYATCSILPEENEQIIAAFVETHSDATHDPISATWGEQRSFGRQLLPAQHDGFYYCRLLKSN